MSDAPLTLGTAGHIDHGKTALIRALTGVDTDRLPEERDRGISIELGYARLELPSGRAMSVIDVPGHERFVRTMVAGATGIDMFLMTIAADDGVMPQTREHAAVLRALAVDAGVVAVTKADLADPQTALREAAELLPSAPAVAVSARDGRGLEELRQALAATAAKLPSRGDASGPTVLHVDRVFTIRGAGTVVTGTLWSGSVGAGDELRLQPRGRPVRVRSVQVHDEPRERAAAGQRVAVNLAGIPTGEIERGDVLSAPDSGPRPTFRLDAQLQFGAHEPGHGDRVQVHHGTRETAARLAWLGGRFWQLRLETPLIAAPGDRLVIRQIAPPDTLGGGVVLDAEPKRHGPSRELLMTLERRARGEPDPLSPRAKAEPSAPSEPPPLSSSALETERLLLAAGYEPPLDADLDSSDLAELRAAGRAVRVAKNLHYHADVLAELREHILALAAGGGGAVTLAQLRDELGASRKFAQALLEHFDAEKLTIRRGDRHYVRRSRPATQ